jgi:hypothetical protein
MNFGRLDDIRIGVRAILTSRSSVKRSQISCRFYAQQYLLPCAGVHM